MAVIFKVKIKYCCKELQLSFQNCRKLKGDYWTRLPKVEVFWIQFFKVMLSSEDDQDYREKRMFLKISFVFSAINRIFQLFPQTESFSL